ncbi:Transportin-1, partial [Ancistrocladus abbreviatus]
MLDDNRINCARLYRIAKLSSNDDQSWKGREAAVLAIGAVAEGCINVHAVALGLYFVLICLVFVLQRILQLLDLVLQWNFEIWSGHLECSKSGLLSNSAPFEA